MNVTGTGIAVALAVIVALGFLFFGTGTLRAPQTGMTATTTDPAVASMLPMDMNETSAAMSGPLPTELTATDTVEGTGATAAAGQQVTVNYVGMLPDGTVFDASANHGQPFTFTLGAGQVIKGWDVGVAGMKVGGKRHLVIPPDMAYGDQAVGGVIPANATLIFDVELVAVQ